MARFIKHKVYKNEDVITHFWVLDFGLFEVPIKCKTVFVS